MLRHMLWRVSLCLQTLPVIRSFQPPVHVNTMHTCSPALGRAAPFGILIAGPHTLFKRYPLGSHLIHSMPHRPACGAAMRRPLTGRGP
jgi:hypothetical protein